MVRKINWLQISDLHFGEDSASSNKCRNQLKEYMRKLCDKKLRVDYIFITGDIVFAKDKSNDQIKKAYEDAYT